MYGQSMAGESGKESAAAQPGSAHFESAFEVRKLRLDDLDQVNQVFRKAFGTQLGHPNPAEFAPGRSCFARLAVEPDGAFGVYLDDRLVGFSCSVLWGSLGIFGPLAVLPEYWGAGVGKRLLTKSVNFFVSKGVADSALCTFPDSAKHISLYKKFGFHPGSLIAMMTKVVPDYDASNVRQSQGLFSDLAAREKLEIIKQAKSITTAIHKGLDLSKEIEILSQYSLGETVLLVHGDQLAGFAICHFGPGSETESDIFYIKFAAVPPGKVAENNFRLLLKRCEILADSKNLNTMFCGVNTSRQEAFETMLSEGFKIDSLSVAMQMSNRPSYNHGGIYVLDDWR